MRENSFLSVHLRNSRVCVLVGEDINVVPQLAKSTRQLARDAGSAALDRNGVMDGQKYAHASPCGAGSRCHWIYRIRFDCIALCCAPINVIERLQMQWQ